MSFSNTQTASDIQHNVSTQTSTITAQITGDASRPLPDSTTIANASSSSGAVEKAAESATSEHPSDCGFNIKCRLRSEMIGGVPRKVAIITSFHPNHDDGCLMLHIAPTVPAGTVLDLLHETVGATSSNLKNTALRAIIKDKAGIDVTRFEMHRARNLERQIDGNFKMQSFQYANAFPRKCA